MTLSEYDLSAYEYELPSELIAQQPPATRPESRLMRWSRSGAPSELSVEHGSVGDLRDCVGEGTVVVVNESQVVRARLLTQRVDSGGKVELLVVPPMNAEPGASFAALTRTSGKLRPGLKLEPTCGGEVLEVEEAARGRARVRLPTGVGIFEYLAAHGRVPLPPYIKRDSQQGPRQSDADRYQTVYANPAQRGSVAAPTAGLHLTPELIEAWQARGVQLAKVVLHVGPGTFLPVRTDDLSAHRVEPEWFEISQEAADTLNSARAAGRRILAVGTTTTRALESAVDESGVFSAGQRSTDLTILPGYRFRAIDALLTNLHLPKSSLLVLVATFAGREATLAAYREAVRQRYRFYSYGDAMLIE